MIDSLLHSDTLSTIQKRRSVFPSEFNGQTIPNEVVHKLLECAHTAPSHRLTQPWSFKVFSGSAKMALADYITSAEQIKMPEIKKKKTLDKFQQSSHILCVCMCRDPKERVPEWEEIAATAMAVQNIWVACAGSQIGGYWSTPTYVAELRNYLNLDQNERCLGLFYLGRFDELAPRKTERSDLTDHVTWFE